jgi:hypothetical protein
MQCQKFSHIVNGVHIFKPKKAYETNEEAIAVAKIQNLYPNAIHKVVPYRCTVCLKFHLGRNGKLLTEKDKKRLERQLINGF